MAKEKIKKIIASVAGSSVDSNGSESRTSASYTGIIVFP
jgi:hypothetical protein